MPLRTTAFAVGIRIFFRGFDVLYSNTILRILDLREGVNEILLFFDDAEPTLLREEPEMRSARGAGVLESDLAILTKIAPPRRILWAAVRVILRAF
jgi:hypothetical protein